MAKGSTTTTGDILEMMLHFFGALPQSMMESLRIFCRWVYKLYNIENIKKFSGE